MKRAMVSFTLDINDNALIGEIEKRLMEAFGPIYNLSINTTYYPSYQGFVPQNPDLNKEDAMDYLNNLQKQYEQLEKNLNSFDTKDREEESKNYDSPDIKFIVKHVISDKVVCYLNEDMDWVEDPAKAKKYDFMGDAKDDLEKVTCRKVRKIASPWTKKDDVEYFICLINTENNVVVTPRGCIF